MCILIIKPADKTIDVATLKRCFDGNPDGAGFAYVNTDHMGRRRLKVKKAMTFSKFLMQYQRATELAPDSNFLIHFRIRTSGTIEEFNNHPFRISQTAVLGHNGIISPMNNKLEGNENDTRAFCRLILKGLPKGWESNKGIRMMVEDYIGWSKLAVLDVNNKVTIFNEQKGEWSADGVWYSNTGYKPVKKVSYSNSNYLAGQVFLRDEKVWVDDEDAVWDSTKYRYVRKQKHTPHIGSKKVLTADDGKDTESVQTINDIITVEDSPVIDEFACEYCSTTGNHLRYRRYTTEADSTIVCESCGDFLENSQILFASDVVSATQ